MTAISGKNNPKHIDAGHDPSITPWEEKEYTNENPAPRRPAGRGMRDWLVLGAGIVLFLYVLGFLLVGVQTPTNGQAGSTNFFGGNTIAVIPLHGEISAVTSRDAVGYRDVVEALDQADEDPSVAVIFLDVDSGGGEVVSSKQIVAKVREIQKPVVTWIGSAGASGAYYIASASDYILADSDSITGSIGVISRVPSIQKLLENWGVKVENISTGDQKAAGDPTKDLTEEQRAVLQELVDQAFTHFRDDVVSFRGEKLNQSKFQAILDGRVVSGQQALDIGLIDEVGTREYALKKAAELGKISGEPDIKTYLDTPFSWTDLFFSAGTQFGKGFLSATQAKAEKNVGLDAK